MPEFIGGDATAEQAFRDNLIGLYQRLSTRGRRRELGTMIGTIRTKSFPENAIAGEQTFVIFVADIRLHGWDDQPVLRDVLVLNQAQQLITGTDADGTPVTVEISASGVPTVIGRAAYTSPDHDISYYTLDDLNGQQMEFVVGLRLRNTSDLDSTLLTNLNAWRIARGLAALGTAEQYFSDPQLDYHGVNYYQGYIGLTDGGRFTSALVGLTCGVTLENRDWYDDTGLTDWWEDTLDTIYGGADIWYAARSSVTCV